MRFVFGLPLIVAALPLMAATDHVHWSAAARAGDSVVKLTAAIDSGWHLYSLTTPQPGPVPTRIAVRDGTAEAIFQQPPKVEFDEAFGRNTETYTDSASFYVRMGSPHPAQIALLPRYQVCSGTSCIPPVTRTVEASTGAESAIVIPADYVRVAAHPPATANQTPANQGGGLLFLLTAFGFGLAAIFTPCVFPMIPITVSFFLNQQKDGVPARGEALKQATLFCLGIIVLFSAMGVAVTALLGPFGVVQLGSNAWVNGLIVLVFVIFGLSLLGAFEITIPSGILNRMDSASRNGGTAGTLLMGLTFSLASFACVGPFVGPLLAASVTGGLWRPLVGMASFAAGLALPFFGLALFPSYLKKLPRSGGWLARVKVVMGFVILAAALKYLAAIDQVLQWNVITRDRFLAAWVVLFSMAGLYLLGFLQLEGVKRDETVGIGRLLSGMALVIFAISLVPGMFGGTLGELEGFVPPPAAGSGFGSGGGTQLAWLKNDFDGAIQKARAAHQRVLVNFTGYACTNCHWMKQNMFTKPEIASLLHDMVLVDLYTDADDPISQANQRLEEAKFKTIAIPYYVIYDPGAAGSEPQVVATFPGLTRDAQEYIAFLNTPSAPAVQPAAPVTTQAAPAFPGARTLTGAALDPAKLDGKVVVANFWATWCVPCRQEIPEFNKLQASLGTRGLEVVGISLDEDGADAVKPFLDKHPMNYTVGLAGDAAKEAFKIGELPVTLVFDRSGRIVDRFEGFTTPDKIRGAVEKVL
jgi:thiol:disulfide interchange protein DsbD